MYGADLSDEENADNMYQMFVNLLAEVITQGVSMIHVGFSKFFRAEYFNGESTKQGGSLALLRGIQQCFHQLHCLCTGVRSVHTGVIMAKCALLTWGHRPDCTLFLRDISQSSHFFESHRPECTPFFRVLDQSAHFF